MYGCVWCVGVYRRIVSGMCGVWSDLCGVYMCVVWYVARVVCVHVYGVACGVCGV